ncbi:MAG: hypothetical protein NTV93_20570 [Verrucomicrobia bacterium]|nr:hypothetical protein [Verrucomicrobiota bacterium]
MNTHKLTIEATSLAELGLLDEATSTIDNAIAAAPDRHSVHVGLNICLQRGCLDRAAALADQLLEFPGLTEEETQDACIAFNYAGRTLDAYNLEKSIKPESTYGEISTQYGLACRASVLGRYSDAIGHLFRSFAAGNLTGWQPWRKAFLDSELAPLWENAADLPISLEDAIRFIPVPFAGVATNNADPLPPRIVDHVDFKTMPTKFHSLFDICAGGTFEVSPRQEQLQPEAFRDFVRWQQEVATARLGVFEEIGRKVNRIIWEHQPAMAEFAARRGRFGAARYHLMYFLRAPFGATPADLPAIPLLAPLIEELRAQHAESPEDFRYLNNWECNDDIAGFIKEGYDSLSPANKSSGLAFLALGNCHYRAGNIAEAIRAWSECRKRWPWDESPVMNIAAGLAGIGRWDECEKVVRHLSADFLVPSVRKLFIGRIRSHTKEFLWSGINSNPEVPTPRMGGLYPGADEQFLAHVSGKPKTKRNARKRAAVAAMEESK